MREIRNSIKKTWVQHLGFWVLSFLVLTGGFATAWPVAKADCIYTLLFHISLLFAVYVHWGVLVPRLLVRRKYGSYAFTVVALMYVSVLLNEYTFSDFSNMLFPDFYFVSDYTRWEIVLFIGLYLILTTSLHFSKSWLELQRTKLVLEATSRANVETELMALRAQVNPHFLFNSLHSIYALALERSEQTPELILGLSNVLRFMLYEADKKRIPVEREIGCIDEFVRLQRMRLPEEASVSWVVANHCNSNEIAPLLLMPLVDNAFKHGLQGEETDIRMRLHCEKDILEFSLENGIPNESEQSDRPGGIGLANVKRRLRLSYPDQHELTVSQDEKQYHVHLKVHLT